MRFPAPHLLFGLLSCPVIFLAACTRQVLQVDDASPSARSIHRNILSYPLNCVSLEAKLQKSLENAGIPSRRSLERNDRYIEQEWVMDRSLRYYFLDFEKTERHFAHWKAVWRLRPKSSSVCQVSIRVFELIFIGENDEFSAHRINDGRWLATPFDRVRGQLWLRRLWLEAVGARNIPAPIAQIYVPQIGNQKDLKQIKGRFQSLKPARDAIKPF